MARLTLRWTRIAASDELRRSSHTISLANGHLSVFGGELKPREPVDNKLYHVDFQGSSSVVTTSSATSSSPPPRVGSAATTIAGKTYIFSGRGGVAMAPIDEQGRLWAYADRAWELLGPADSSRPVPPARSYHAMANDSRDAIYVHAGCPEKGRLNDLWAFIVSSRRWVQLASAPGNERGGTSIAFCGDEDFLFRVNGFDGTKEIGGSVDVYNPVNNHWTSKQYKADGIEGPEPRSVGTLLSLTAANKSWLITAFGERDPSSLGHQGAGKMLSDVWAYDVKENQWTKVEIVGDNAPQPRGWFAADVWGSDTIVVHGGLAEDNSRLGDAWIGKFGVD